MEGAGLLVVIILFGLGFLGGSVAAQPKVLEDKPCIVWDSTVWCKEPPAPEGERKEGRRG